MVLLDLMLKGSVKVFTKTCYITVFTDCGSNDLRMGRADTKRGEIYIADNMSDDNKEQTLLHEVLHHINDDLVVGLKEEQIERLSVGFYNFLKENEIIE